MRCSFSTSSSSSLMLPRLIAASRGHHLLTPLLVFGLTHHCLSFATAISLAGRPRYLVSLVALTPRSCWWPLLTSIAGRPWFPVLLVNFASRSYSLLRRCSCTPPPPPLPDSRVSFTPRSAYRYCW